MERLLARLLAYVHSYRDGLCMTNGLYEPELPALSSKNLFGDVMDWIDLGCPDPKRIERVTRAHAGARVQLYFYQQSHVDNFKQALVGMKSNFLLRVELYLIDPKLLETLKDIDDRYLDVRATVSDQTYYFEINGRFFETSFERLYLL